MNTMLLYSSIAKKVFMAMAGLFLVSFLCVHLGINLMLLKDDGGRAFTEAATFMGTNALIKIFEIVLFAGFLIHIFFGMLVSGQNKSARPTLYAVSNHSDTAPFSNF